MCRIHRSGLLVLLVLVCFPTAASARTVTEIIFGNTLICAKGIAVDDSGNVYVT